MTSVLRANAPQFVIGLFIMLLGLALILDRLSVLEMARVVQFWPVILIVLGASVILQATGDTTGDAKRAVAPVGPVVLIVLLGLLFTHTLDRRGSAERATGPDVALFALMGGDQRALLDEPLEGAQITSVMGEARLDLRSAAVEPGGEIVVDVFTVMGGAIVQVPAGWIVDVRVKSVFGGIRDNRRRPVVTVDTGGPPDGTVADADLAAAPADPDAVPGPAPEGREAAPAEAPPRLVLEGVVVMGGLSIRS